MKIQNNVSIYQGIKIENDVFCGPSVVFTNVKFPISYKKTLKKDYEKTLVEKKATLGANSTIVCGVTIGKFAFVGAGALVNKDIKPYALVVGNPESYRPNAKLVRIKYENSTRYEYMIHTKLELLPIKEQYPAHGGTHQRQENEL